MNLLARIGWAGVTVSAIVFGLDSAASAERPPNIVMFLVDDLGATDVGCYGSSFYETPRIDRLAREGVRFTAAYSACPVCSPTRASIMTGRYPQRTGVTDYINYQGRNQPEQWNRNTRLLPAPNADRLAPEERTIAEALRDAGYATFCAGKWHLGQEAGHLPTDQGFDVAVEGKRGPDQPLRLANKTCRFIAENAERPFFVYLSFNSVHIPLFAPAELIEKYEAKAARLPKTEPAWGRERDSDVRLVQDHPVYAGMIETMDRAVGIVLDQLEQLGLRDNTLVVFTSDNGGLATAEGTPTSNLPLRTGKGWLYEGGIRVPAIIRWPGVTAPGSTCAEPIISNDYFATLLEAAGQSPSSDQLIDGLSLVPLLRGEQIDDRPLYWHYPHYGNQGGSPGSALREGRWKIIEWFDDGTAELFDLEADPGETQNLAERHPDVVDRLHQSLAAWRRDVKAKMPTPNPRYAP